MQHNCHVIVVFDGRQLPAKQNTNNSRRLQRNAMAKQGERLLAEGKTVEAMKFYRQSATITDDIIRKTLLVCVFVLTRLNCMI